MKISYTLLPLISIALLSNNVLAADNTLNVYTYSSFSSEWGPGPIIKKAFEAQCDGCKVNFVSLEDGVSIDPDRFDGQMSYNRLGLWYYYYWFRNSGIQT